MAVIDSSAGICNLALLRATIAKRITDLDTDTSSEGAACRDAYDTCLDEVLGRFRWKFAEAMAVLSRLGSATWDSTVTYAKGDTKLYGGRVYLSLADANLNRQPDTSGTFWRRVSRDEWSYVFTWPADCVAPREVASGLRQPRDFEEVQHAFGYDATLGTLFFCDIADANLRYTARHTGVVLWPAKFKVAMAARLSVELAAGPKGDHDLSAKKRLEYEYEVQGAIADQHNMEGHGAQPESSFITARS